MSQVDVTLYPWNWFWRTDGGEADCGIFAEVREGHAYAVFRCPKYMTRKDWEALATKTCDEHNAALTARQGA